VTRVIASLVVTQLLAAPAHPGTGVSVTAHATAYAAYAQSDVIERARTAFDAGRYSEAAQLLEPLAGPNTLDAPASYWFGRAKLEEHDYRGAVDAFARAVNITPNDAEYRRWLARAQAEIADRERSFTMARRVRQQLEQAARLDPSNVAVHRDLMGFYLEAPWLIGGGEGKAKAQIEAIAALDPVAGHLARAAYWRHKNDRVRAKAEYEAALASSPPTITPYLEAAEFYERVDDAPALRAVIERAEKINADEPQLLFFRGALKTLEKADLPGAEEALRTYLNRVPPRSDRPSAAATHEWLGRLYEALGHLDRAIAEFKNALTQQSDRDSARDRLRRLEQR
jgi:tetratricopeptide (TPR) repeat protein